MRVHKNRSHRKGGNFATVFTDWVLLLVETPIVIFTRAVESSLKY